MKKISNFFYKRTSIQVCLAASLSMGLYAGFVLKGKSDCFNEQLTGDLKMLDINFNYDVVYAERLFNSLNEEGLQCYLEAVAIWDIIFPIVYGAMYLFWLSLIYKSIVERNPKFGLINLYPFIPIIADWSENITEKNLVLKFMETGNVSSEILETTLFFTRLKWGTSILNYLLILFGISILVYRKIKEKA